MKKLLWITCILSVGLNIYLVEFENSLPELVIQDVDLSMAAPARTIAKKTEQSCPNLNSQKLVGHERPKASEKLPTEINSEFDYENFKKESTEKLDRFIVDELSLDLETSAQVIQIFEQGQKEFDDYLNEKQKRNDSLSDDDEPKPLFFDAHDYIKMGRNRLETKRKLRDYLGDNSFKILEQFVKKQQMEGGFAYELL